MNTKVIIQGSSKSFGNTHKVVNYLNKNKDFDLIDLATKRIEHFDYEFKNEDDDFIPLIKEIVDKYDTIIFATPVYWYTMSGILKVFFDRLTDLLTVHKPLGDKFKGKKMAMISNSGSDDILQSFSMPFIGTANYLNMKYLGDTHAWFTNDKTEISKTAKNKIDLFRNKFS